MDLTNNKNNGMKRLAALAVIVVTLVSCSVSYRFNGASIDYTKTKTIGEITQYSQRNKAVTAEGTSAQAELSMTVNVRFTNNANHTEDFERQFTATASFETTTSFTSVQEELVTQMVEDITDQIFNATVANW